MPLNDVQFRAVTHWLRIRTTLRARLDFIWDGLSAAQQTALRNRVKADVDGEYDAQASAVAAEKNDVTGTF